jgi:hypothetical protein
MNDLLSIIEQDFEDWMNCRDGLTGFQRITGNADLQLKKRYFLVENTIHIISSYDNFGNVNYIK